MILVNENFAEADIIKLRPNERQRTFPMGATPKQLQPGNLMQFQKHFLRQNSVESRQANEKLSTNGSI